LTMENHCVLSPKFYPLKFFLNKDTMDLSSTSLIVSRLGLC
jgi:hypothetical protein